MHPAGFYCAILGGRIIEGRVMKTVFLYFILLCMFAGLVTAQTTLWQFNGLASWDYFGCSVARAGDVNWDGFPDIVVGAPSADPGGRSMAGQVRVFSGKDGSVLHTFNGLATVNHFGGSVAGVGDVNRDGYADIVVGAQSARPGGRRYAGQATVFSGKDGSVLHTFNGLAAGDMLGFSVAGVGDVDRDGFPDFIVGAPLAGPGGRLRAGQVRVFSGKDGSVLHTFNGLLSGNWFGYSVAEAGDVDRDGFPDFIVGAPYAYSGRWANAGQVRVFSGKDGSVLHTFNGIAARDSFGISVAGVGDVNRDGFPEFIVGAIEVDSGGRADAGQATVFSVATTAISGSGSPRIGRTMNLNLTAFSDANLPYHVGSSLSMGPIQIDNRLLNLSPDVLFVLSIQGLFPTIFSNYIGIINNSGQGTAAINIPNTPLLIGIRIHSAFVTISGIQPSGIRSISNSYVFTIIR